MEDIQVFPLLKTMTKKIQVRTDIFRMRSQSNCEIKLQDQILFENWKILFI